MVVLVPFLMSLGNLYGWIIGYYQSWRYVAFCSIAPCVVIFITMLLLPETPYWLIENSQFDEAHKSLKFFRNSNENLQIEFDEIAKKRLSKESKKNLCNSGQIFLSSSFLKPFSCVGVIYMLGNLTGFEVLVIYMVPILRYTGSTVDPELAPIIIGTIRVFSAGTD